MAHDQPVKALVLALTDHTAAAVYAINRLQPDSLCFVLPERTKSLIESEVQPKIEHMPRRWDWVVLAETGNFFSCYQALARTLPDMLQTWNVQPGDLVVDMTGATPAMAGALALATRSLSSRIVSLIPAREGQEEDRIDIAGQPLVWTQGNPWDEAASVSRREGCELFNRKLFAAAAKVFREVEARVSGGQKPLYRAFADLADGYDLWERFHYRQGWEKLKSTVKAFELASLWGGPPGLTSLLPAMKANAGFLEKLVLDPAPVKDLLASDLLAHAGRRLHGMQDPETAMISLVRAFEAFAQRQLFKQHNIKTWDVQLEELPQALRETCRACWLEDLDGKYKLPLQAQFRALAGLGDQMGQAFLREWPTMKPLLDAANHAVLGHGFEPVKAERVQQLYEVVLKLSGTSETALPKFPMLNV
jgi:CRISPR-associated protein (TIGR02710 family)